MQLEQKESPLDKALREMVTTSDAQFVFSAIDSLTFVQRQGKIMDAHFSEISMLHMIRVLSPRYTDPVRGLFAAIWYEVTHAEGHGLELFVDLDQGDLAHISSNDSVQDALALLIPLYARSRGDEHIVSLIDTFFGRGCTADELHTLGIPCWNLSDRDRIDTLVFLFQWYMGWYNPVPPERKYQKRYRLLFIIDEIEAILTCSTQDRLYFLDVLQYLTQSVGSHLTMWINSHRV